MSGAPAPLVQLVGLAPLAALAVLAAVSVLVWPGRPDERRATTTTNPDEAGRRGGRRRRSTGALHERLRALRPGKGEDEAEANEVQLLDGLAAALDAGLSTEHALQVVLEPLAGTGRRSTGATGAWTELARAAREGQPLAPSWARLARRTESRTAATVARAWAVATATGAPLAAAVRSSAHAARERRRLERAVEVATAGARATAAVLGLLPVAGIGLAALLGVGPGALYGDPLALASAGLGLVLLAGGHMTVRRMVGRVLAGVT